MSKIYSPPPITFGTPTPGFEFEVQPWYVEVWRSRLLLGILPRMAKYIVMKRPTLAQIKTMWSVEVGMTLARMSWIFPEDTLGQDFTEEDVEHIVL